MTLSGTGSILDDVTLRVHRRGTALVQLDAVEGIYASAYAEPPYREGPEDVGEFCAGWPHRVAQPSFRLVVAWLHGTPVGFTFGHQLTANTRWWNGLLDQVDEDVVTERPGRTFAVIELAVQDTFRRSGIGRELHTHLLAGLTAERATLLVRPDAIAARSAYLSWGYRPIGSLQPFPDGPTYEAMIKELSVFRPSQSHVSSGLDDQSQRSTATGGPSLAGRRTSSS